MFFETMFVIGPHTCIISTGGHDAHTAMLLGAAMLLKPYEKALAAEGKVVRFTFQPAEEGGAGGKMLVDEGALDGASGAFALHTSSQYEVGKIVSRPGVAMAADASFTITVNGIGGHAAMPFDTIDPVNAAAQVVLSLNTIVGRMNDNPNSPIVISLTTIHGGDASNIVPNTVTITGTIRALSSETMTKMMDVVKNRAIDVASANGCTATVQYTDDETHYNSRGEKFFAPSYPETYNNPSLFKMGMHSAVELFKSEDGTSKVEDLIYEAPTSSMGGEDFAFFSKKIPSVMFHLGHASDEKTGTNHHHPQFQIDEDSLHRGAAFYAILALDYLASI